MTAPGWRSGWTGRRISRREFARLATTMAAGGIGLIAASGCVQESTHHHTVKITDTGHFDPGSVKIPVGDSIVWQNKDVLPHTATCDPSKVTQQSDVQLPNGAQPWNSGTIQPGQTWSYQFNTRGTFVYFSIDDEQNNFIGTVVVTSHLASS